MNLRSWHFRQNPRTRRLSDPSVRVVKNRRDSSNSAQAGKIQRIATPAIKLKPGNDWRDRRMDSSADDETWLAIQSIFAD